MNRSLREVLASSHVAAVAILVLLFSAIYSVFRALWPIVSEFAEFLATAVAILDIPDVSFHSVQGGHLVITCSSLYTAAVGVIAAWLLSLWVYGLGPVSALMEHRKGIIRRLNAEI